MQFREKAVQGLEAGEFVGGGVGVVVVFVLRWIQSLMENIR